MQNLTSTYRTRSDSNQLRHSSSIIDQLDLAQPTFQAAFVENVVASFQPHAHVVVEFTRIRGKFPKTFEIRAGLETDAALQVSGRAESMGEMGDYGAAVLFG